MQRRDFLNASLLGSVSWMLLPSAGNPRLHAADDAGLSSVPFDITRQSPTHMYDGTKCWCHPRAGIVPGGGDDGAPRVVMTMNTLDVSGSDVFKAMHGMHTDDLGDTWSGPYEIDTLAIRHEEIGGEQRPVAVSDFWPGWHNQTKTLLGTGHTVVYTTDWKVRNPRPRHTTFAVYDAESAVWQPWQKLQMPGERFNDAGAGCVQRYDESDGSILLPIYFRPEGSNSRVIVARCEFDGKELRYVEHGEEIGIDNKTRGLHEPSLTRFGEHYYLTLRNDEVGFVTRSTDGLNYEPYQTWRFDDGEDLGNYNTQQHWVTHSDGLFLVYTRRGADNDHVFRHRAPLFIGQVDPEKMCVIRDTEQVLVPERGARLGNFGVTYVSPQETWVTVAEWMQTWGPNHIMPVDNKYGSDGSIWIARIRWEQPNRPA